MNLYKVACYVKLEFEMHSKADLKKGGEFYLEDLELEGVLRENPRVNAQSLLDAEIMVIDKVS